MKNRVVETDDNVTALEIICKGTRLLCYTDKVDLPEAALIRGTWHINRNTGGHIDGVRTEIQINKVRKQIWLHNLIFEKSDPENVAGHIDHSTLNNVGNNLGEVSKEQNAQNVSITLNSTAEYRNITIEDGKYRVRTGGHSFGRYNTLEEAQEAVRRERKNIFPLSSESDNRITVQLPVYGQVPAIFKDIGK